MDRWAHQIRALEAVRSARTRGVRRLLVTTPTGGGKTIVMNDLAQEEAEQGRKAVLYTNRKVLVDQTARVLALQGIDVGVRAAGYSFQESLLVQVSSVQTEGSRVLRKESWGLHDASLVLVDEAHSQTASTMQALAAAHLEGGATVVGFTATPIGLGGLYDELIVAGTNSELRACGALVPAYHYGCDEPAPEAVGKKKVGFIPEAELSEKHVRNLIMREGVFGRVIEWFRRLNPEHRPTILFAPGVPESVAFCDEFNRAGISAAHIDGESVYVGGRWYRSDRQAREGVLDASRAADVRVVCNRFVLREGVDAPWLEHGILATVFGSLQSYLQSGGRLLRSHPGVERVTVQDHGGNWWRWGSLNADHDWSLGDTDARIAAVRDSKFRDRGDPQPCLCPRCGMVLKDVKCPCGHELPPGWKRARPVVESDGTLVQHYGDPLKPRRTVLRKDTKSLWERMYYRARNSDMTFRQAAGLFACENYHWPPRDLPLMPKDFYGWFCKVRDVAWEELIH
jgi:DNA repair protein RadD